MLTKVNVDSEVRTLKRLMLVSLFAGLSACANDGDIADGQGGSGGSSAADAAVGDAFNPTDASTKPDTIALPDASGLDGGVIFVPDAAPLPCQVKIRSVTTPDLNGLPAGPGMFVRLRGEVLGQPQPVTLNWQWRIMRAGVAIAAESTPGDASSVRVPLELAGTYTVAVSVAEGCVGEAKLNTEATDVLVESVFLRLIPPSFSTAPPKDDAARLRAGTNTTVNLVLTEGTEAQITATRMLGGIELNAPAAVRITSSASSFLREGSSPFSPRLNLGGFDTFDVLLVPEDVALPPLMLSRLPPSSLRNLKVPLTGGVRVAGKITRNGTPIVGARMLMRKDQQPSTIGETDAAGFYSLRARPGMHSVRIVPPANSSGPTIELPAASGLLLNTEGADVAVNIDYTEVPTATLTLTINKPDGSGPAPNTIVDVVSPQQVTVATMKVGSAAPTNVPGVVTLSTVADAAGQVVLRDLPRGIYTIKLRRPQVAAWPSAYQTTINVDLRAGDGTDTVKLAPSLLISGTLNVMGESPKGLRVVAVNLDDKTGSPEATGEVTDAGAFVLNLSPQAAYRLRIDPPLGRLYPRVVLGSIATETMNKTLPPFNLPKTVRLTGKVSNSSGQAVPGTIVQAYCSDLSDDCIDNSRANVGVALPLSEAVTDSNGSFVLVLPDPGSS